MKRIGILAIIILPLAGYMAAWAQQTQPVPSAQQKQPAKAAEKEKTFTITSSQLNDYVQKMITARLKQDAEATDKAVLDAKHWHTAIYEGVIYHVYTGPGNAMAVSWADTSDAQDQSQTPPAETPGTVPATTPGAVPPTTP